MAGDNAADPSFMLTLKGGRPSGKPDMKIKVVVHDAEEGGFWAEVPAIPGCTTQGETMDELLRNLHEAIEGCLSVDVAEPDAGGASRILEIAV
jgi:predicted RNase H-like HicB family nuclease